MRKPILPPGREPKLGHYTMVLGILMLMFIGFNRIWHFVYVGLDAMLCGIFKVQRCGRIFLTHKRTFLILSTTKSKSLSISIAFWAEVL